MIISKSVRLARISTVSRCFHSLRFPMRIFLANPSLCRLYNRSVSQNKTPKYSKSSDKIRNIGLIAHIDAGKTTTTERMLYFSGAISSMGEVHDGQTVMDHMVQERERGITITSAAASIRWLQHYINILDTPGHVDFTFEVERSLSVMDGAVVILDATSGVQAQTLKVWNQANKYSLSRLVFCNKMDRSGANIEMCCDHVKRKLRAQPLQLHVPLYDESGQFNGIIDIPTGQCFVWSKSGHTESFQGKEYFLLDLHDSLDSSSQLPEHNHLFWSDSERSKYFSIFLEHRESLIGTLCDFDEQFATEVLQLDNLNQIPDSSIQTAIRNVTLSSPQKNLVVPVLCGSSYRNVGVQPLLNSICLYLPGPRESVRGERLYNAYSDQSTNEKLCALAFKIVNDRRLGSLTFVRLYSGFLMPGQTVLNANKQVTEKISRIYRPFADHFQDVSQTMSLDGQKMSVPTTVGDIVAVEGLASTFTGDTLVHVGSEQKQNLFNEETLEEGSCSTTFAGIPVPDPVFYCSLEAPSLSKIKQLQIALSQLQREDPSLKVQFDSQNDQIIIKGMGELHIEIIKDRIRREYGIEVSCGNLQVSYQESIQKKARNRLESSKTIGNVANTVLIDLEIAPKVVEYSGEHGGEYTKLKQLHIHVVNSHDCNLSSILKPWHLKWIHAGVFKALQHGPLFAFPVVGIEVYLHNFTTTSRTTQAYVVNAVTQCTLDTLKLCHPILLEPVMALNITTPTSYVGSIMSDLSARRTVFGDNQSSEECEDQDTSTIKAFVPLAELVNYSSVLRTISSGMASFDMTLHTYAPMNDEQSRAAIDRITGVGQ